VEQCKKNKFQLTGPTATDLLGSQVDVMAIITIGGVDAS